VNFFREDNNDDDDVERKKNRVVHLVAEHYLLTSNYKFRHSINALH